MSKYNSDIGGKAKVERKLYLARENPEPIFDLSNCGLKQIPSGVFSLCRVFLKHSLRLEHNKLACLKGGGNLIDLVQLKLLDLSFNDFLNIPEEIGLLVNLLELRLNNNKISKLPVSICNLNNLRLLDVSNNKLKKLPEDIGVLSQLQILSVKGNKLNCLPTSICKLQLLDLLECDTEGFIYPPQNIVNKGTDCLIKYICDDLGYPFNPNRTGGKPQSTLLKLLNSEECQEQKLKGFLEVDRLIEIMQQEKFLAATASKTHKEKLLSDIKEQQSTLDSKLAQIHKEKDVERQRFIEHLRETEENTCLAVKQLLALKNMSSEDLVKNEENEKIRLLALVDKRSEFLSRKHVLADMEQILAQETEKFKETQKIQSQTVKGVLSQETCFDAYLSNYLAHQNLRRHEFVAQLQSDENLQRAAVGALLERGDARSWGLIQQVKLVESQLAELTAIEMKRRKLQVIEQLTNLTEQRLNLSALLMHLLNQQNTRRTQLLTTLNLLDNHKELTRDFWLKQYQYLLERLPKQKNMDPKLTMALLAADVIHCLPFLGKIQMLQDVTDDDLLSAGIRLREDRNRILKVFTDFKESIKPSAPLEEGASAPAFESLSTVCNECSICMDQESCMIFIPCGHLCCCNQCSDLVESCPMCRTGIQQKVKVISC